MKPNKQNNRLHQIFFFLPTLGEKIVPNHLGMIVDSRVDTHALYTSNHFGDFALVDGAEARAAGMCDLAR